MIARLLAVLGVAAALASGAVALAAGGGRASGWAVASCALLAAIAALALNVSSWAQRSSARLRLLALALALAAWGALGGVPLPGPILERVAPRREAVERAVPRGATGIATWAAAVSPQGPSLSSALDPDAARAPDLSPRLGPVVAAPASHAPWATRSAAAILLGFLLLLVALSGARSESPALALVAGCAAFALAAAVAGLWFSRATPALLFGRFESHANAGTLPYGLWSRNHAAALFALTCPILLACALDASRSRGLRLAAALALLPVAAALVDDGSRGGLIFGAFGAILLGAFLLRLPGRRIAGGVLVAFTAAGLVIAFTVLAPRILHESLEQTTSMRGSNLERMELYALQARMVRESPLLGNGLGAFRTALGVFRENPSAMVPLHGESDWMETLVEGGIPAMLLWVALAAALLLPPLRRAVRGGAPPLFGGLVAGACAVLAHAAFDFHLREPLVALAAIAAASAAFAWDARLGRETAPGAPGRVPWLAPAGALAAVAILGLVARREIPRDLAFREAERLLSESSPEPGAVKAREAAEAAPRDGDAWALLGFAEEMRAQAQRPGVARRQRRADAIAASVRAIELSPASLGAARRCASILLQSGAEAEAADATRLALAVSGGSGATRRVAGQLLLRHGPSPEALQHLGFAFRSLPLTRIHQESPAIAAWMLEAAGGDPVAAMKEAGGADRIAWFVSELARAGREQDVRACLKALAASPPAEDSEALAGLLLLPGVDETLLLARALKAGARSPVARQRIGIALVRGGDLADGLALLRGSVDDGWDSPEAWLAIADAEAALGRPDAAAQALREGAARHPDSSVLKARSGG